MKKKYIDKNGYARGTLNHSDLIHRQIAYEKIYIPHRNQYPLPFSAYQVHHIDKDRGNNILSNLLLLTEDQHAKLHGKYLEPDSPLTVFGTVVTKVKAALHIGMKGGFGLGVIILMVYVCTLKISFMKNLAFFLLGLGALCFFLMINFTVISLIYTKVANFWKSITQDTKLLFGKI